MMTADEANGVKTYMIYGVYEGFNVMAWNQYLLDSVDFLSYWNHLPLLYAVKTRLSLEDCQRKIAYFFRGQHHIIVEVDFRRMTGMLPQAAWDWFLYPAPPTKQRPPALLDLFGGSPQQG